MRLVRIGLEKKNLMWKFEQKQNYKLQQNK